MNRLPSRGAVLAEGGIELYRTRIINVLKAGVRIEGLITILLNDYGTTMKFCVVTANHHSVTPGGAELQSHLIASELSSRSHDCHYLAYASDQSLPERIDGVNIHTSRNPGFRGVLRCIKDIDSDVYYFRNMVDIPLAAYVNKFCSGDVVYNISHTRQCMPLFSPDKTVEENVINSVYGNLKLMFRRGLLSYVDNIVVQTKEQQKLLQQNRGINAPVIGNGQRVPETEFEKADPPIVLWLASLKQWKRPKLFLRLAEECEHLDAKFQIVGRPADQDLANYVQQKSSELDGVEYLGGCSIEESNRYIARASLFVNTSIQEGFPNTFLQSWFRKTPVVSLSVDPDSILTDNDIGLVPPDFDALTEAVPRLIRNDRRRRELAEKAYEYAKENHDIRLVVNRLETHLQS